MDYMRELPDQRPRVETGPVKFGDDWPGLFIRGDQCIELREVLQGALDQMAMPDRLQEIKLQYYIESCDEVIINGGSTRSKGG
jgi:hypothetical protein